MQTILSDSCQLTALARVFSIIGVAIALSPAFGLLSGGYLVSYYGHMGVFIALSSFSILLLVLTAIALPQTRPENTIGYIKLNLAVRMARDSSF
ncbi:MFS transporter [Candidatus Williamhamiltonella defendens]|uniref:MFS transporter n=1 Tax=Candidatus Williamhamiltonella defendens TaxID=138072 RepID=UPI001F3D5DED|nr:MFS transporter [Candidatus Hamiltonella defensa]